MKLTTTELHFPRAPWRFNLSNLLEHYPAGARRFAALRGRLLLPLVPTPRAPAFLSVRALKKPTPRHRRTFRTRQPLASSTHDLDTMVTRWSAPIPLCTFVSSEQRTRVLSLFFRCLIMLVDFMPAVHLDTCPLTCIAMAAQLSR